MLSLVILIAGGISLFQLPVSEYPEVVPPTVVVTASYPGANPTVIAQTVATPLEQEINGTENMLYMFSQGTSDGRMTLTVTFALGTDLDRAQVQVQNRVNSALPRLPEEVQRLGVVAEKSSPDLTMVVHLYSPEKTHDTAYLSNYADLNIKDEIAAMAIAAQLNQRFAAIDEAFVAVFPPPPIQGLGTTGGFKLQIEDRANKGFEALFNSLQAVIGKAQQDPALMGLYSSFRIQVPQMDIDIDREQALIQGIPLDEVFNALQIYLGSVYVNDFNMFGRTYQVNAQADADYRKDPEQILNLKVRNRAGHMVPLGSVLTVTPTIGPDRVMHYNGYPSAELNGSPAPGYSSDQAQIAIEKVLADTLPSGIEYEWTEVTYQQVLAGNTMVYVFPLVVLLVFMVLAAQYESLRLPLAIILIVPMTIFSALLGVWFVGSDNNIFTQIALIVLVALASKNAILMVEFAKDRHDSGLSHLEAILEACRMRLRPILMTSIAFTAGVVPLVLATGAGSEMRHAMGNAVFSGMIGVTVFGLLFTPVFYMLVTSKKENAQENTHD